MRERRSLGLGLGLELGLGSGLELGLVLGLELGLGLGSGTFHISVIWLQILAEPSSTEPR